jgi:DNA-binding MarR family transcriptional regulator
MSQLNVLTLEQARVRALLERYPNVSHSAEDVARHFGIGVPAAVIALQELRRRGYARRGPAIVNETAETALYDTEPSGA